MQKTMIVSLALLASWRGIPAPADAQVSDTRRLYQITSGTYEWCCGIGGGMIIPLPNASQAFVAVRRDSPSGRAEMTFLDQDQQTAFLTLTNGLISGPVIHFRQPISHPYAPHVPEVGTADYTATEAAGTLRIDGSICFPAMCCDIPTFFGHSNVVAAAMPVLAIRVSEVEVSWRSESNRIYQVQYRSDLTTNRWTDLGPPVPGTGVNVGVFDKVPAGQPQRFYRVIQIPNRAPTAPTDLRLESCDPGSLPPSFACLTFSWSPATDPDGDRVCP